MLKRRMKKEILYRCTNQFCFTGYLDEQMTGTKFDGNSLTHTCPSCGSPMMRINYYREKLRKEKWQKKSKLKK